MVSRTDRIEKKITLRAPRERVWRALTDSSQFGIWFGAELDGPFVANALTTGRLTPTKIDAEIAKHQAPHAGRALYFFVESLEPPRRFAYRWHPYALDPGVDFRKEPTTLVEFILDEEAGGTMLTIVESGFDQIRAEKRAQAFTSHQQGWPMQASLIEKYLATASSR